MGCTDATSQWVAQYPGELDPADDATHGGGCGTWRGGGFRNIHKQFFSVGKEYRVPQFLATAVKKEEALEFIKRARNRGEEACILWCIKVDRRGKRDHQF